MTETRLKSILSEWITESFTITDYGEIEDAVTRDGHLVSARDYCLHRYRAWLNRLLKSQPRVPQAEETFTNAIRVLEGLPPGDELTVWEAQSRTRRYRGLCSRFGMVTFYDPEPLTHGSVPDDPPDSSRNS